MVRNGKDTSTILPTRFPIPTTFEALAADDFEKHQQTFGKEEIAQ